MSNLETVDWAYMLPGSDEISEYSSNSVWKGPVLLPDGSELIAFTKFISNRAIFVECACALLGRQLGVGIPKPLVVYPDQSLTKRGPLQKERLGFGSVDADSPSFTKFIKDAGADAAWSMIEKSGDAKTCGVFDEWIANPDRSTDNVLYAGNDEFVFIDHELALPVSGVADEAVELNQLLENVYSGKSEFEIHKLLKDVETIMLEDYKKLNLATLSDRISGMRLLADSDIQQIIDYLDTRIVELLLKFIKERLTNQLQLDINSS